MKQSKQRVIAIDYFRGLCILMVLLNHSAIFSSPYYYLAGGGVLWTTAAEMFLLLSGLTLWVVRGKDMKASFIQTAKKIWRRAAITYAIYLATVFISLGFLIIVKHYGWTNGVLGILPDKIDLQFIARLLLLQYSVGWANFLLYFCVYLLLAPFALYIFTKRFWPLATLASIFVFLLHASPTDVPDIYGSLLIWQVYFFIGITLGRLRPAVLQNYFVMPSRARRLMVNLIITSSLTVLLASILYEYNLFPVINKLSISGWLPMKLSAAYSDLLAHKQTVDFWMLNGRYGALRPLSTLILLSGSYAIYQRYNAKILSRTGSFINTLGRDTMWIFVAQSITIPLLALPPLPRNYVNNLLLTSCLILSMWAVTQRGRYINNIKLYLLSLKISYSEAKYAYLQQYEDGN